MKRKQLEQCAWDATPSDERRDRVEHRVGAKYRDRQRISEPRQRMRKLTGNNREILVFDPSGSTPGTMSPWMPLWALFNDELRQRCDQGIEPKLHKPYHRNRRDYKSSIEGDEPEVDHATKRSSKKSPAQLNRDIAEALSNPDKRRASGGGKKAGRYGYENGQHVSVLNSLGDVIGTGRVRSGDNYPESNEYWTWVTMTRNGETVTEEHPTRRVIFR